MFSKRVMWRCQLQRLLALPVPLGLRSHFPMFTAIRYTSKSHVVVNYTSITRKRLAKMSAIALFNVSWPNSGTHTLEKCFENAAWSVSSTFQNLRLGWIMLVRPSKIFVWGAYARMITKQREYLVDFPTHACCTVTKDHSSFLGCYDPLYQLYPR